MYSSKARTAGIVFCALAVCLAAFAATYASEQGTLAVVVIAVAAAASLIAGLIQLREAKAGKPLERYALSDDPTEVLDCNCDNRKKQLFSLANAKDGIDLSFSFKGEQLIVGGLLDRPEIEKLEFACAYKALRANSRRLRVAFLQDALFAFVPGALEAEQTIGKNIDDKIVAAMRLRAGSCYLIPYSELAGVAHKDSAAARVFRALFQGSASDVVDLALADGSTLMIEVPDGWTHEKLADLLKNLA